MMAKEDDGTIAAGSPLHAWAGGIDRLLRARAIERPSDIAFSFLTDDGQTDHLTVGALDERASSVAAFLRAQDPCPSLALLAHPPGLEFIVAFFGCLYAGTIAIPAPLPVVGASAQRLLGMVADSGVTLALTATRTLDAAARLTIRDEPLLRWVATEDLPAGAIEPVAPTPRDRDRVAFLQYTSGSTTAPKGVAVTHGNLIANEQWMQRAFRTDESWTGVSWLPHFHDMGLIGGILHPFFVGFRSILMSPLTFLKRPVRWLRAIPAGSRTISGAPNFAYEHCVRRISPEEKKELDLSGWEVAFCGSERVRSETLDAFCEAFRGNGFSVPALTPCYGLAENTLFVSGGRTVQRPKVVRVQPAALEQLRVAVADAGANSRDIISCGPFEEGSLLVVDPSARVSLGADRVGEIWVRGSSVAQGYWKHARETQATFAAKLQDGEETFLRTGDLGFVRDGELFVTGRLKETIILDGRNLFPEDVERTVLTCHASVANATAAAFAVDVEGQEGLAVVLEVGRAALGALGGSDGGAPLERLKGLVRAAVADEHGVRLHGLAVVRAGTIPRTSSGKTRRAECRARYVAGAFEQAGGQS